MQPIDLSAMALAITRIGQRFTGRAVVFSPGQPIAPVQPDPAPRQFQYPASINLSLAPRRDIPGLTPFDQLRYLAGAHPLAALCIRTRCDQMAGIRWRVVARDTKQQKMHQRDCDLVEQWWDSPDRIQPRISWIKTLVRDVLEIDAPTLYKQPNRGGWLYALNPIDGATIKPLLNDAGHVYAYQQVLYGLPLSQYRNRAVRAEEEEVIDEWGVGELWYQPYTPSTTSPYGRPPMEDMLTMAKTLLQKQDFDLGHFSDGNIPGALGIFDASSGAMLNPDQVGVFETDFNTRLQGDVNRGSKIRFIPFPMKIERLTELSTGGQYESRFEEQMVKITAALYGLTPAELGFTADVNRATAESQQNTQYRIGIGPMVEYLRQSLFNPIIWHDLNCPHLEMIADFGESEDELRTAQIDAIYAAIPGVVTGPELRILRYADLAESSGPVPALPADDVTADVTKADDRAPDLAERESLIAKLTRVLRGFLGEQGQRIVAAIGEQADEAALKAAMVTLLASEQALLVGAVLPLFDDIVGAGWVSGMGQISGGYAALPNAAALKLASDKAAAFAASSIATTDKQIAQVIADWIATGGTLPDLKRRVLAISDRYVDQRSDVAAITEVTRLFADANRLAWQESAVVNGYEVRTSRDEAVCVICQDYRGKTYPLTDTENLPPYHARCRCWVVPVVD